MSSSCSSCSSSSSCASAKNGSGCGNGIAKIKNKYGNIKNIVGVISGKGGVGKSTVTGMLASQLAKKGYKVGVLDADITGPSMPRFFGINEKRAEIYSEGEGVRFIPVETGLGIKVISLNLITEVEDEPVIWRGPVINGVLNQMYQDTVWGDLDYLLIDMPPGTGDITLTVMQSFPLKEIIIVSTPQDMVSMIVKKLVVMAEKLGVPVRGVVENMAYILCGKCGERMNVFSKKSSEEHAKYLGLKLLGELPINLDFTEALENGKADEYVVQNELYTSVFKDLY
ncbi:Mrp/NBP35 family ATP-binding protein [Sarcina sp. JB2]|uniref:Mrp/NBP35 family ATP-binding protein n=1 Tax=Candidatus Sarcina troglodytae TaxID=2726954 RepID=A0ACD1BFJ0_9CLOT|nr:Mrp/NBP35 family ATP-binding protein [Sarcina sp. JB2]QPJ86244.1 Mrp/NBP35 family ATP-binding protein [Sarcina sp. JB2]